MAELTPTELEAARGYLRAPEDDDEAVMAAVKSARAYLEGAGVALPPAGSPRRDLYDTVCHSMALSVYDHRGLIVVGVTVSENPVLRSMLNQLKLTEPANHLDAGEVEEGDHDGEDP